MSRVAAIGDERVLEGYALAGVDVLPAQDAASALAAWRSLEPDVTLVLLSTRAHRALADELPTAGRRLWTVVPG